MCTMHEPNNTQEIRVKWSNGMQGIMERQRTGDREREERQQRWNEENRKNARALNVENERAKEKMLSERYNNYYASQLIRLKLTQVFISSLPFVRWLNSISTIFPRTLHLSLAFLLCLIRNHLSLNVSFSSRAIHFDYFRPFRFLLWFFPLLHGAQFFAHFGLLLLDERLQEFVWEYSNCIL